MTITGGTASERLALLLAGGGVRCRRLVAAAQRGDGLLVELRAAGAPGVLLSTARDLLERHVPSLLERIARTGWRWVTPDSAEFPSILLQTADPPLGLFVRGRLGPGPRVALVGSRRATAYGLQVARLLGCELARSGVVVVSGMARGVDAAAHEGALEGGGGTWAVWGTGPDRIYPPEHGRLAEAIAARGALLTEYPPGTPPRRYHFPERNRLLAGMAQAVVVVEAGARSGALVTARLAVDEGREVYAVPGSILSEQSLGPNALLRLGARPLLGPSELLADLGVEEVRAEAPRVEGKGGVVLHAFDPGEAASADELAARCGLPIQVVLGELLELEIGGRVERWPDGRFSLVHGLERSEG